MDATISQPNQFKMKKIIKAIQEFLSYIYNFRSHVKHLGWQKSLKQAVINDKVDRIIAIDIIVKDIKKILRLHTGSAYIPDDIKNREEVRVIVISRHGEKMKSLNIELTQDLKLV